MKPQAHSKSRSTRRVRSVYEDLGYADAQEMQLKAELVSQLSSVLKQRGLRPTMRVARIGTTPTALSKLLRGQFQDVSVFALLECFCKLGLDVAITVRARKRRAGAGSALISVVRK